MMSLGRVFSLRRLVRNQIILARKTLTVSSVRTASNQPKINKNRNIFKTEDNLVCITDPNIFGTLSGQLREKQHEELTDSGDIEEENKINTKPLPSTKLTTRQYADLMKEYIKHKRLKEAIDVLEVKMLKEDRVQPENYIYNILIGACADVGYTQKAFKLYNDMKKRALKVTGDTYTCLFNACANSPWQSDGLKRAKHLRELMMEKMIEPNITNYNSMIKAFGRCGELPTAFQLVDEMIEKKIPIRVHTFNFLLQACISDTENGARHALIVWRKMLMKKEKPNIYSFNLMLKCLKECSLGTNEKLMEAMHFLNRNCSEQEMLPENNYSNKNIIGTLNVNANNESTYIPHLEGSELTKCLTTELILKKDAKFKNFNLLSKVPQICEIELDNVKTPQDRFNLIGGHDKFLNEMSLHSVKPDIKTFTQMLSLIPENNEVEIKFIELMKYYQVLADVDFYNMLMKRRCLRKDYASAKCVIKLIEDEAAIRKKKYPLKKKLRIKPDLITYGVLALTCQNKGDAQQFLQIMRDQQIKVNIEIMGTLLKNATMQFDFDYVLFIMNKTRDENLKINIKFLNHLKIFNERCNNRANPAENISTKPFRRTLGIYRIAYKRWLNDVGVEQEMKSENPWKQFTETQPETLQRQPIKFEIKKYKKLKKGFVKPYIP